MARPSGHQLHRPAWDDILRLTGLSLTEVADMAEIPRSTVSSLLGGFHKASVPQAHKLARAAGCNPSTIFPSLTPRTEAVSA